MERGSYYQGFMLSHWETGAGKTWGEGNGSKYVKGTYNDESPTSKIYTTWARILSDRNTFCAPRGGRKTVESNALGLFLFFLVH